eukprot:maker-scaffold89_size390429-snap-gene-2.24 protein:Tk12448 transcript:maker-scaffold89_size390429-snap-gene-2.24-mRNA-1 annotation:"hypothetical protein DAPPUDRAFT_307488"
MRAFVDLAALMSPLLKVSFFRPSIRKFLAPPIKDKAKWDEKTAIQAIEQDSLQILSFMSSNFLVANPEKTSVMIEFIQIVCHKCGCLRRTCNMRFHLVILSLAIGLGSSAWGQGANPPFEIGPYATEMRYYDKDNVEGLDHNLYIYAPNAAGTFPIVYFSSAFAGNVPAPAFKTILEHIASHGYVLVCPFKISFPTSEFTADWLIALHGWVEENLISSLVTDGLDTELGIDFSTEFVMGHSAGSHVICEYMKATCGNVQGMIMMSPVDGVDELGLIKQFCVVPPEQVNFDVPTLIIPAGLDSIPGVEPSRGLTYPCAPEDLSNERFFDGMTGVTWMVNVTDYGHADVLEPELVGIVDALKYCAFHEGGDPEGVYRRFVAGEILSFMRGIMGECELLKNLEDPTDFPVDVEIDFKGREMGDCDQSYCIAGA